MTKLAKFSFKINKKPRANVENSKISVQNSRGFYVVPGQNPEKNLSLKNPEFFFRNSGFSARF